ncbi:hypothetical protein CgunFtcFv8_021767 [Champsocephalus gunnari]|uniref:Uncharacterized protein n=1 Tax=Champsocephalus gunnari TaxID=52237 RepID=A0AAN8DQ14_CHAGU|nr:hypothetical protein CgunFtcFv8_021767 [Champsocephalus gunnari]
MDSFCLGITAVVGAFDVYREEGREGSSSSSEVFFMWKLHQDLTTKRAPCHLQPHGGAHPQSPRRETDGGRQPTKSSPRVGSG